MKGYFRLLNCPQIGQLEKKRYSRSTASSSPGGGRRALQAAPRELQAAADARGPGGDRRARSWRRPREILPENRARGGAASPLPGRAQRRVFSLLLAELGCAWRWGTAAIAGAGVWPTGEMQDAGTRLLFVFLVWI
jgi:hypothetical protein